MWTGREFLVISKTLNKKHLINFELCKRYKYVVLVCIFLRVYAVCALVCGHAFMHACVKVLSFPIIYNMHG